MRIFPACLCALFLSLPSGPSPAIPGGKQAKTTAEQLGFAADAKLLIIHADDVGLAHSVDTATFRALEKRAVSCGSIMVPCPWFTEAAAYAKSHPEADLGLHLTLTSEWKSYRWGSVASAADVPGLLDPGGSFWPDSPAVLQRASAREVEAEVRAQIDRALKAGIRPTHLDSHMATLFGPSFFPVYVRLAREYGIPFFATRMRNAPPAMAALLANTDLVPDAVVMAGEAVTPDKWLEFYTGLVRNLKPGLTEMIVHLGEDDAELQAVTLDHPAFGSAWRQRDYAVMTSPEFARAIKENGVTVIGWREIQKHWIAASAR